MIASRMLIQLMIVFVVCIDLTTSQLICWRCDPCPEPHDNSSSSVSAASCTSSQTVCVKNTVKTLGRPSQIAKGCVTSCTPSSANFFGQGSFVDCCNTDYCNSSSISRYSMLILLGLIGMIFINK